MRKCFFICMMVSGIFFIVPGCSITSEFDGGKVIGTYNPGQTDPIYFTEDSSFAVSDFLNRSLGIKKIVIQKGDYVIDFTENPDGRIEFRIDEEESDFEETYSGPVFGVSVAIRIARRKSKHYPCYCCSGIGFRCGFVSLTRSMESYQEFERTNTDQKNKYASVSYNKKSRTIQLDFLQQVDWQELDE